MDRDLVAVGKIIGVKGLKGEIKVQPLSDNFHRHKALDRVKIIAGDKELETEVEKSATVKNFWILKFKDVLSREEAEELRGCYIMIPKAEREELPENHYYMDDIIGSFVFKDDGSKLGQVINIIETGSNDVYVVKSDDPDLPGEILVPALKDVIKRVDIKEKKIVVVLPEGLLD
ncbi:MAG: 16S rRNA processing protein RimM [Candidatus Syntrophonatronum acetioxidans]|uniref:Ribosome maturation factor RimM n=1 Tax=Candidatus Syntrophonatronum acetioxidans TaxID=1795816 RepID=A0A424YC39_9FIRM|nr:MAG: 16S rRNA processing protein RimM [Candidatus Syntrophonatronum acetioxidans]